MGCKLVKFEVINFSGARIIGKSTVVKTDIEIDDPVIETLWKNMRQNNDLDYLLKLSNKITEEHDFVGWSGDFNPGDNQYTYLAGVLFNPNTEVPDGYEYRDIASCEMAVGWLLRTTDGEGDIHVNASEYISKAEKENGYEYDGKNGFFEMEYYSNERFYIPERNGENVTLDFYSPCKKIE
jgi:predicted transcriptional regulator YdeE